MRSPSELAEVFRANGGKLTPQRQLLLSLLDGNTEHPTAEAVFAQASVLMPGISLRTVYTTLTDLAEMGEIQLISVDSGATRFDPNVDDHHHMVCSTCGAVLDVYVDGTDDLRISGAAGLRITSTSIVFHGTCADCAASTII
jgi:Fe2+ or Zn2+ uptake regulation protein